MGMGKKCSRKDAKAQGVYSITFFSNGDSIRFKAISDSCVERMKGMERTVLGKVK